MNLLLSVNLFLWLIFLVRLSIDLTDGTTHHHWMCHFEYASYALPDVMKFATDLNDTEFRFSPNIRRMLRRSAYTLDFCLVDIDKIPPNLNARAGKATAMFDKKKT